MIRSFSDGKTRRLFEDGRRRGFRGLDYERALMLLDALHAASSLTAVRLGRYFGTGAAFWMNLQTAHDISIVEAEKGCVIENEVPAAVS